ncbi:hypothetical protein CH063_08741 [Colletotrichum higginsianum]|uniref:GTPase-activating protein GYP7 n=2 Tax=Colletotrichum higginsianum TaxID=80884 RepID=H1VAY0_COLHI|nr:GTPase-activating protein GYP7 [Colletotrichum higginsianum IMI 349063]OBR10979.1 GTPase-activating protein GYP7 [Colletotrichum higginsianum IMI 349063]TID06577.1 hypothetical protein CH35J_000889 [Colletotrichum higginsianum]GJD01205.1 GTPase-activating protein GYP7 [Colletotrichum higginsianum]CCF37383.1 hypothetical protein CH063_08741 [Colletotrichum higginsianum]
MSSWYSRILTNTTSQISNLQSRLLQSENDGDTEDDTHVCRVLRGYYTEKGRPFPGWLPPDPKAPPPVTPVYAQPAQQVGSRYGGLQQPQQPGPATGLSSLWDNNAAAAQPRQDAMSLRQGRGAPPPMRGGEQPARLSPFARAGDSGREEVQARPLPSQRAGSYQQSAAYGRDATSTPPGSSAGGSAQDRLKQRLWGGSRTASPSSGAGGQGPFQPPAGRGGGGGGGSNADYEDRFAPGGMYDGGNGGGGGGGGGGRPFIASNSPWSNNEPDYGGGGGGGGGGGRTGLPNGPRRQGLPSGPRMR